MSNSIDLNHIRSLVHANQREGNTDPAAPKATIVVDRDARIRTGDTMRPGEGNQVSKIQQDTFHGSIPQSFSGSVRHAAASLGGHVTACDRRVWNDAPLMAADLGLPGGITLLILATDHFPGIPPLVFVTEGNETRQLQIEWNLGEEPENRLHSAFQQHFHGSGPFRSVFGPSKEVAVTDQTELANAAAWRRFYSGAPLVATDPEAALHARSGGLLSRELSRKHVFVSGLGSGGSYIAEQLVRAGVGELTLLDPDTVDPANLSRTTYAWDDVGQPKTLALARHLRRIRPDLRLHLHIGTLDSFGADELLQRARECDLLLALTDDPSAQALLNQTAYLSSTPAVFAGLYAGAKGGEIILCLPGRTPCYRCATGGIRDLAEGNGDGNRDLDYGNGRLSAETALAADIHHLDSATVKLSLSLLVRNLPDASLSRFVENALDHRFTYLCLAMSPDYWIFPEIFKDTPGQYAYQGIWLTPEHDPGCPVCGDVANRATHLQAAPATIDLTQFDDLP
jgi:molybdopterin/thiamine biosynthesis adenylyltransferase